MTLYYWSNDTRKDNERDTRKDNERDTRKDNENAFVRDSRGDLGCSWAELTSRSARLIQLLTIIKD